LSYSRNIDENIAEQERAPPKRYELLNVSRLEVVGTTMCPTDRWNVTPLLTPYGNDRYMDVATYD